MNVRYCANLVVPEHCDDPCLPAFKHTGVTKACHCRKGWGGWGVCVKSATIVLSSDLNLAGQCSTYRMLASYGREAPSCALKGQYSGSSGGPSDAVAGPYGPRTWAVAYNLAKLLMYVSDDDA